MGFYQGIVKKHLYGKEYESLKKEYTAQKSTMYKQMKHHLQIISDLSGTKLKKHMDKLKETGKTKIGDVVYQIIVLDDQTPSFLKHQL